MSILTLKKLEADYKAMPDLEKKIYRFSGQMGRDLKLVDIDIQKEYKLIMKKKSRLSCIKRKMVVQKFFQLEKIKKAVEK